MSSMGGKTSISRHVAPDLDCGVLSYVGYMTGPRIELSLERRLVAPRLRLEIRALRLVGTGRDSARGLTFTPRGHWNCSNSKLARSCGSTPEPIFFGAELVTGLNNRIVRSLR
jgi:hypothetical protein